MEQFPIFVDVWAFVIITYTMYTDGQKFLRTPNSTNLNHLIKFEFNATFANHYFVNVGLIYKLINITYGHMLLLFVSIKHLLQDKE